MLDIENCLQKKIDNFIIEANEKISNNNEKERNEIDALVIYLKAIDLFEFINKKSNIQQHEILFKISFLFDLIGNKKSSLNYIEKSIELIPNVPIVILFKSIILKSLNKNEEAQQQLIKFKHLCGKNDYYIYIHDIIQIIYFFLLKYDEEILLFEIKQFFNKFQNLNYDKNHVIYYLQSKICQTLYKKYEKIDTQKSKNYEIKIKECLNKAYEIQDFETNYLINEGINNENISKILIILNPQIAEFKPKILMNYNQVFHSGFSLFSTLFKIVKIIKFKSQRKKVNEYYTKKLNKINLKRENSLSITKGNSTIDETKNFEENIEDLRKEYQIHIRNLYNSVWLIDYFTNLNIEKIIFQPFGQIDDYYIKNGYYSKFNLKQSIIQNLDINEQYKKKQRQKNEKKLIEEKYLLNSNKLEIPFKLNKLIKKKIKKKLEFKNKNIITIEKDILNGSRNSIIKSPSDDNIINNLKKKYSKKNSKSKRKDLRINNMNLNYNNYKLSSTHRLKVFSKDSLNSFRKNSQEKISNEINYIKQINIGLKFPENNNNVKLVNHYKLIPHFIKSNSSLSKCLLGNSLKRKKSHNSVNQSEETNQKKYLSISKSNYKISSKSNSKSQNKTSEN